jgi:predicted NAD/FAD-binding protein
MSFSVRIGAGELEWAGSNLATVFAQPSNLVSPSFLRMLRDLVRFNRQTTLLAAPARPSAARSASSSTRAATARSCASSTCIRWRLASGRRPRRR